MACESDNVATSHRGGGGREGIFIFPLPPSPAIRGGLAVVARSSSSSGSCLCLPPCVSQTPGRTGGSTTRERERDCTVRRRSSFVCSDDDDVDGRTVLAAFACANGYPPSLICASLCAWRGETDGRTERSPPSFTCKSSGGSGRREEKRNLSSSSLSQSLLSSPGEADTRTGRRSLLPLPLYQAETKPHSATFTSSPELAFLAWEADEAQSGLE